MGVSYVRQQLHSEVVPEPPAQSSGSFRVDRQSHLLGITGGVGVRQRISRRMDVVPRIRIHVINRDDGDFSLRVGGILVEPSVMARFRF